MSWDVLLINLRGGLRSIEELDDDHVLPLGPGTQVRAKVSRSLPGTSWDDPSWGIYRAGGWSIEFNAGKAAVVKQIMLHVRGRGAAVADILQLCADHGWSALDLSTSELIDPTQPSEAGWEAFQRLRDQVVGRDDPL